MFGIDIFVTLFPIFSFWFSIGVYVTASTGVAAVNIGGRTFHSFAGIELGIGKKVKFYLCDIIAFVSTDLLSKIGRFIEKSLP